MHTRRREPSISPSFLLVSICCPLHRCTAISRDSNLSAFLSLACVYVCVCVGHTRLLFARNARRLYQLSVPSSTLASTRSLAVPAYSPFLATYFLSAGCYTRWQSVSFSGYARFAGYRTVNIRTYVYPSARGAPNEGKTLWLPACTVASASGGSSS